MLEEGRPIGGKITWRRLFVDVRRVNFNQATCA